MVTCFEQNLKRNLYIIEVQILHRQKGTLHCHTHVTLALLDAANDKDPGVQEQVRKSILTLGNHQPDKVLSMCQDYLVKHSKLVSGHRVVVLQTIELVVKSKIDDISSPKIKSIITLASDEMTRSKEIIPDWQQTASNILVAVGNKYINDFMEEILSKFQPGVLPHFYVVETLASLSDSNVYGMVPFLNAILGTMLPMLSMAKQDNMKLVFSSALSHFSESILEYLANLDKAPDPTVRRDTFSGEIYTAYDVLFSSWLQSRDPKLRLTVAEALGAMSHLIAQDKLEEQLPRLLPALLSLYKKNPENYIISKSLCQVLDAAVNMGSRVLETQIDGLLTALHQQDSIKSCNSNERHILCLSVLGTANAFPDRLMVFVLQRLENSNERSRIGSLTVLRHLINSTSSIMETKKLLVLASIKQPLADHSNKVKQRVVQVISAMAHHGYLELEGGEVLVRFIIQHCSLPDSQHVCSLLPAPPASVTAHHSHGPAPLISNNGNNWKRLVSQGVAMGVGLCARSHLDDTLAKLEEFGKSDAFKKASGIFGLLKNDVDVEKMKSTMILCYGHVALHAPEEQLLLRLDTHILRSINKHFNTKVRGTGGLAASGLARLAPAGSGPLLAPALATAPAWRAARSEPQLSNTACVPQHIESWLSSRQDHERERAMRTVAELLQFYLGSLNVKNLVTFHNLGALLGRLAPRCTDPSPAVRTAAVDCIYTLLHIQLRYEGFASDYRDDSVETLLTMREKLSDPDPSVLYKTCSDLTKRLPHQQLNTLIFMLFEGLVDSQSNCSRASSVILNTLLRNRGAGLQDLVPEMLEALHVRLQVISEEQVKVAVAQSILILASQHLQTVINTLLSHPLPWDSKVRSVRVCLCLYIRAMAKHAGPRLPAILESLCPSFNNIYECQRITVTAFCSELLNHHVVTELMMIDMLMNSMMERISDPCSTVRMLAVRGLGNVAVGSPEKVNKYAKELLAAMSSGMEEKDDPGKLITLEAMSGLSKVLLYLDQQNMHLLVVYIFMKIKPFLENENDKLRCASIMLLGNLSRFGSGEAVFKDQIHNVLVSLLMHLNDPNAQVVKACKYTMRVCAPVVGSEQITAMFHNHLHEEKGLHYGEFINDLIKYIIQDFPGMLNFYHVTVVQFFKSNWSEIRASAAMFIGEKI
uniref:Maestro heat-like repeat family member 1 n=1 Tax=Electrophorus electricus TaxID=8005 RepID=A0AAY5EGS2_ELEEL